MKPETLKERLKNVSSKFDVHYYRRPEQVRVHQNMCSVRYKNEHLTSMHNIYMPLHAKEKYGYKVNTPDGEIIRPWRSVNQLCKIMYNRKYITSADWRYIMTGEN